LRVGRKVIDQSGVQSFASRGRAALDTNVDYLSNGNTEDKAKATLVDAEMIRYFKEMDTLPQDDKTALLRVMSGFIRDVKTKQAYAS
jgi:hypothetical protein